MNIPVCSICDDPNRVIFQYEQQNALVWFCRSCEFTFVNPLRSTNYLKKCYDDSGKDNYTKWRLSFDFSDWHLATCRDQLADIHKLMPSGKLLEIGCSTGSFLKVAQNLGYEVSGVELSHSSAVYAKSLGLDVFEGTLEEANYPPGTFDIIYSWHCFEHISDPKSTLRTCYSILADGGIIKIGVPNARSFSARLFGRRRQVMSPDHIHGFSVRSLSILLEQIGFVVDNIWTCDFDRYWFLVCLGLVETPKDYLDITLRKSSFKNEWRKVKWFPVRVLTSIIARTLAKGAGGDNLVSMAHKPS